ncbi:MAG TPA: IS200/IS605 family transposase [Catalimonadaceae bacterium]|nr:IS200/IS605 family transposase [Catalimonadaceae bacterium]
MAYVKIMVHAVWSTKYRHPWLTPEIRKKVIEHIRSNAREKGIKIDRINGYTEHLHCLFWLNADMSVAKALQLIKGESSHWINQQKLTATKFEWGVEYYAASVSESVIPTVRKYIENQEQHHSGISFEEEFQKYLDDFLENGPGE